MRNWLRMFWALGVALGGCVGAWAQSGQPATFDGFEVATIRPVDVDLKAGRMFRMEGTHRWVATNFTVEQLIALAYDLNPRTISGGPEWVRTQRFVISAVTPGDVAPTRLEQMRMLRALLVERFGLKFHRQEKQMEIYELTVAKDGPKLKAAAKPEDAPRIVGVVYPDRVVVPARSVSMEDFVAMLQRATLDRPTVDRTGLTGKYDFDLVFTSDDTLYGGELPKAPADAPNPPLFTAVQEQLGLKLTAKRGAVSAMVVDALNRPSAD
jgi:uncharacterized protein (TIGR03435 family)